ERLVTATDGDKLTIDKPLEFEHTADGEYRGDVANLSRNVVIESAQPEVARGHTMFHKYSQGSISYAEFRHLGKEGVLGRYSLHFHLCGDTMRGARVIGSAIWHSAHQGGGPVSSGRPSGIAAIAGSRFTAPITSSSGTASPTRASATVIFWKM